MRSRAPGDAVRKGELLAKNKRPPGFDPHPGDPWHPDWPATSDAAGEEDASDEAWWRQADGAAEDSELAVPEIYASLPAALGEETPDLVIELVEGARTEEPAPEPSIAIDLEPEPAATSRSVHEFAAAEFVRSASSLARAETLALAESTAHEDASMWEAVAVARTEEEEVRAAAQRFEQRYAEREAARAALAAEARRIDAATAEAEEARRRTEAEVREALERPAPEPEVVAVPTEQEVAVRFARIAAQLEASDSAETDRLLRREQIRLRTSLLLVDAEEPWETAGWSRPGASLRIEGVAPPGMTTVSLPGIVAGTGTAVPQSVPRRRWPWSRKMRPEAAAPQELAGSVLVMEETPVSGRNEEEGQEPLPFDGPAGEPDPGLDDDLASWSDLDFDYDDDQTPEPAAGSADEPPIDFDAPLFESPDSADSADEPATVSDEAAAGDEDDFESFTAGEYVQTATQDYADLAAAVAAAEEADEPMRAAIAADMPGLETSPVSLDDVVAAEGMTHAETAPARSNLTLRILTALGLITLFFASLTYRWSVGVLVVLVLGIAAGELVAALVQRGYHPVALFAYLGTAGVLLGTWAYGPVAVPVALAVTGLVVTLFFGLVTGRAEPLVSTAITVLIVLWVGVLGAFLFDMIPAVEYRWLIGALVVIVAVMDVGQYFIGRRFGKRPLAPVVSPKKTVAGLVGGVIVAVGLGYAASFVAPFDVATGLILGGVLAVTGPLGDLAVSVFKRAIGTKDMGTILPGHGGVMDRVDAMLFSLPAAWVVYAWAGLLV